MWNVDDDDLCDIDVEVECSGAGERFRDISIPRLARDNIHLFWDNVHRWSAVDSDGDSRRRCSDRNRRGNLRECPGVNAGMGDLAFAGAECFGSDFRSGCRALNQCLVPFDTLFVRFSCSVDT